MGWAMGAAKRAELIEGRGEVYTPLSLAESFGFPTFRSFFLETESKDSVPGLPEFA